MTYTNNYISIFVKYCTFSHCRTDYDLELLTSFHSGGKSRQGQNHLCFTSIKREMTHQHRELYTLCKDTRNFSTTRINNVDNIKVNLNTSGNLFSRFHGIKAAHRFISHHFS